MNCNEMHLQATGTSKFEHARVWGYWSTLQPLFSICSTQKTFPLVNFRFPKMNYKCWIHKKLKVRTSTQKLSESSNIKSTYDVFC
mgnify:CR=1 FL=1